MFVKIKNRKRHSTFGRISSTGANPFTSEDLVQWNNDFGDETDSELESEHDEGKDQVSSQNKISLTQSKSLVDGDQNIFEIDSDSKISESLTPKKKTIAFSEKSEGDLGNVGKLSLEKKPLEDKRSEMEIITEIEKEQEEEVIEVLEELVDSELIEEQEGRLFFERQARKNLKNQEEINNIQIIRKSVEGKEQQMLENKWVIQDIKDKFFEKKKFSFKGLFRLLRFDRLFGGLDRSKQVTFYNISFRC